MRLLLVRHLEPAIAPGLCYGRLEVGVHPEADPAPVVHRADGFHRVWTSPARRCRDLADRVATRCGTEALIDPRLHELDFGAWEGRRWDALPRAALDRWAAAPFDFAPPDGENGAEFVRRVGQFCAVLREDGEDAVVITHGGPLRIMPALLRGEEPNLLTPAPGFGSVIEIETSQLTRQPTS